MIIFFNQNVIRGTESTNYPLTIKTICLDAPGLTTTTERLISASSQLVQ